MNLFGSFILRGVVNLLRDHLSVLGSEFMLPDPLATVTGVCMV